MRRLIGAALVVAVLMAPAIHAQAATADQVKANIEEWNDKWTEPAISLRREVGSGKTMDDVVSLIGKRMTLNDGPAVLNAAAQPGMLKVLVDV